VYEINEKIAENITKTIDAKGKILIPGLIDTHVHFREPGLTHKAQIYTESKAAVAGGITSFFEMPNTKPPTLTENDINSKIEIAKKDSLANFAFYIGVSENNISDVLNCDTSKICGVKMFMGNEIISNNEQEYKNKFGENVPIKYHSEIRSAKACYKSSNYAISLAKQYGTKLHIAHLSTKEELDLFDKSEDITKKQITGEVCVHHLWFSNNDYDKLGTKIKCNPSIKDPSNKDALLKGLLNGNIDTIATDHAPHTSDEKENNYFNAPSGIPIIQQSLQIMLEHYHDNKISLEKIVEKMCHNPSILFDIEKRGFIREGYYADIVLVNLNDENTVKPENVLYKCKWSPLEGYSFKSSISHTFVNGKLVYENGVLNEQQKGMPISFNRK